MEFRSGTFFIHRNPSVAEQQLAGARLEFIAEPEDTERTIAVTVSCHDNTLSSYSVDGAHEFDKARLDKIRNTVELYVEKLTEDVGMGLRVVKESL